ncbi:phage holin family protein [Butyrivibrio proteoclasticus]|uniref:phage holin family protein n=1 Tax=Butyrivibrio proteoclasticus TaxID=43305 RepID=UPI00047EC1FB|nr:phage holin family protein [Butyrivibrio proteoclasticus]
MKNIVTVGQYIFTGIGGVMGWLFGGFDGFLYALIAFVMIDYITGVLGAIYTKQLSSEVGFKGIAKKVIIFLLVGIGNIIDMQILKTGAVLRTAIIFFYLSNEGISIIENAARLDLPIPEKLIRILEQIKDDKEG